MSSRWIIKKSHHVRMLLHWSVTHVLEPTKTIGGKDVSEHSTEFFASERYGMRGFVACAGLLVA